MDELDHGWKPAKSTGIDSEDLMAQVTMFYIYLKYQVKTLPTGGLDMLLFRLDASIRVEGSHSRAIADIVEQEWHDAHPGEPVIRRHVGLSRSRRRRGRPPPSPASRPASRAT